MKNRRNQEEEEGFFLVGIRREGERERQEDKGKGKKANPFPLVIYFLWPIITSYHVKEEIFGIRPSLPLSTDPFYYPLFFFIAQFSSFIQCEKDKKSAHQTIISPSSFFFWSQQLANIK